MKKNTFWMLPLIPVLGVVGMLLRYFLYQNAVDRRGLLVSAHPLEITLWILVLCTGGILLFCLRDQAGTGLYEDNFGKSPLAALGCWALSAAVLLTPKATETVPFQVVLNLNHILRFLCAVGLSAVGFHRLRGETPFFGFYAVVALFFASHLIVRYQTWSSNPQLQDSIFAMLGCICMTLFAYQHTAFCVGIGSRRSLLAAGLLGCCFCCVSLPRGEYQPIYLAGIVWMLTNLCKIHTAPDCAEGA